MISAFGKWSQKELKFKIIFNYIMCPWEARLPRDTYMRPNQKYRTMPRGQAPQMKLTNLQDKHGKASFPSFLASLLLSFIPFFSVFLPCGRHSLPGVTQQDRMGAREVS